MAVHPKDRGARNPRMFCPACRRWMRLHASKPRSNGLSQLFLGGCSYTGGDHVPINGDADICEECCPTHCAPFKERAEDGLPKEDR